MVGVLMHCSSGAVSNNSMYSFIAFLLTLIATILGIVVWNWLKEHIEKCK